MYGKNKKETRRLKVNINKTKLIVIARESAVRPQRGRYACRACSKGVALEQTQYAVNVVKSSAAIKIFGVRKSEKKQEITL